MIVRRLNVWSVARLYGALCAAMGLLAGSILALLALAGGMSQSFRQSDAGFSSFFGALFGVGAVIFLPIFYGVLGVIVGALAAALYNLFAGMFGGIEMDIEP